MDNPLVFSDPTAIVKVSLDDHGKVVVDFTLGQHSKQMIGRLSTPTQAERDEWGSMVRGSTGELELRLELTGLDLTRR